MYDLDDYVCPECGRSHETCFCENEDYEDYDNEE